MKRLFDLLLSFGLLLALALPLLLLSGLVRRKLGSPVLFRQVRPGLHGRPFMMVKFRTMTDERGADGELLPDARRMTPFGRFLRATSLDELPELWNVLRGEMSLVGPRPLLMEYLPLYSPEQARRHEVRPGITGWSQVNGRNALSWEERFKLDVWYVDHRSLWLDLRILWLTVRKVIVREGISAQGEATMPRFSGQAMKRLALLGASGHGKVVADAALAGGWDAVEFFDDAWPQCQQNGPWPVKGDSDMLLARLQDFQGVIVSIGDCAVRWAKHQALQAAGAPLVTVVHPAAVVSPHAVLGAGTVVIAGAVVNIDAVVGQAGIINTGATVDHDCRLGDAVHICPGAHLSGNVRVGHGSWVGVGAVVKQGMILGERVMVGAGSVVVQAVPDGLTVIGNPAMPMGVRKT